jgi:beta-galactosidase
MIHVCVRWVLALLGTASAVIVCQSKPREVLPLQENWEFYFAYNTRRDAPKQKVTLPHTWNASEVPGAGMAYYRGTGNYSRRLRVENRYRGKRLFLRFEGVNSVAHVFINQKLVGEHQGGYTAFCLEITSFVKYGEENLLTVLASNAYNPAVLPFSGDFNVYGGIHRPAWLLVTEANCISPLDHASSGVYLEQSQVSRQAATVKVRTRLSLAGPAAGFRLQTTIRDAAGKTVLEQTVPVPNTDTGAVSQTFTLQKPRLWNGKADPYRYQVTAQLLAGEKILDAVTQPLGLRYYRVDPQGGFFLNGQYLDLRGFCRHEDVQGKGSALSREDHQRDMDLLKEIGATTLRLTHYPHSEYFYELCDQRGIVVWTEIPLVGPGGYTGAGYVKSPRLEAHGRQVLKEMIRQQYNHPSICFWGLFNELKMDYDDPVPYLRELNELAKQEDPARPTVSATFLDEEGLNGVTHLIAWNKYFGWYGGKPEEMGTWADQRTQSTPGGALP